MTRTNDLGNEERRSASDDATSNRTCNGKRKLNRGVPLFSAGVGKPVSNKEKESAGNCGKKSSGNGAMEKRGNMRSDVEKVRERLPRELGESDERLSAMHDRIPSVRGGSSDEDISGTVHLKQNKSESRDEKNNGLPSVDHSCGDDNGHTGSGCTTLPPVGKNAISSLEKHRSTQNLEKEPLQIHLESEASVPCDDSNLKHRDTLENSDCGNHEILDAQSSDDATINLQKQFDVGGHTDVAELSVESGDAPKGNCREVKVGNSIDDSKLKPNLELSNLIDRIHSKLSDAKAKEETAKDIDETESIDGGNESESTDDESESETSGESESSDEESESDVDRSQASHGDDDRDKGNVLSFEKNTNLFSNNTHVKQFVV